MLIMRHSTTGTVVPTLLGTNTVGEQRDMPRDRPPQGLTGYHDFPLAGLLGFCRLAKYRRFYFYANGSSLVFPVRKRRNRNHLLSSNRARERHRVTVSSSVFSDFGFMFQQDDSLNGLAIRMQLGLQLDNRVGFDN